MNTSILILAAGESKRFGSTKLLVKWNGQSLIRNTVEESIKSRANKVYVVVGNDSKNVISEIDDLPVSIITNELWHLGMSSSIKTGINQIYSLNPNSSILISVADQPYLDFKILDSLILTHRNGADIAASEYRNGVVGVPAIFSNYYRKDLQGLEGDEGARMLFKKHSDYLQTVEFDKGDIDIDKPEDIPKGR